MLLVTALGCVSVLLVPLADNVTLCPDMGFPYESLTVAVRAKLEVPFAVVLTGEAASVEVPLDGAPAEIVIDEDVAVKELTDSVAKIVLLPAAVMNRPLPVKSATPLTAFMLVVPERLPVPEPTVSVTSDVASAPVVTTLP